MARYVDTRRLTIELPAEINEHAANAVAAMAIAALKDEMAQQRTLTQQQMAEVQMIVQQNLQALPRHGK